MKSHRKELLARFFERSKLNLGRCLAPGLTCTSKAIQAHSLQNSQVLGLLATEGHVTMFRHRIDAEKGPAIFLDEVGRNQATTFTGFCGVHDAAIFKSVDTKPFDSTDVEQLFLVAYRAVARELHTQMEGAARIQGLYSDRVQMGLDSGGEATPSGVIATQYLINSYESYLYKARFDEALVSGRYDLLLHDVIPLQGQEPTVAVCSLFSVDNVSRGGDPVRAALNVLPLTVSESVAVFSYLPEDADLARASLARRAIKFGEPLPKVSIVEVDH